MSLFTIQTVPDDHGPLVSLCWSISMSGMMMYSGQKWERELSWEEDGSSVLTYTEESEGDHRTVERYSTDTETAQKLRNAVTDEVISWSAYRYDYSKDEMRPTDVSGSAVFTLTFAAGEAGGEGSSCSIDLDAARQNGKGDTISEITELLKSFIKEENLLDRTTEELRLPNGMTKKEYLASFSRMPGPSAPGVSGSETEKDGWKCPECGNFNTGRFCSECGTPQPV